MLDLLPDPAKTFTHPILTCKHGIPELIKVFSLSKKETEVPTSYTMSRDNQT